MPGGRRPQLLLQQVHAKVGGSPARPARRGWCRPLAAQAAWPSHHSCHIFGGGNTGLAPDLDIVDRLPAKKPAISQVDIGSLTTWLDRRAADCPDIRVLGFPRANPVPSTYGGVDCNDLKGGAAHRSGGLLSRTLGTFFGCESLRCSSCQGGAIAHRSVQERLRLAQPERLVHRTPAPRPLRSH